MKNIEKQIKLNYEMKQDKPLSENGLSGYLLEIAVNNSPPAILQNNKNE